MAIERKTINLVKDESQSDKIDYVSIACSIRERDIHDLAVLREYLEKVGITLNATRYDNMDILSFKINNESYTNVLTRGAGRKKDYGMAMRYKECTVADLKMKLVSMKKSEIIKELGCPKATFYRILKNLKEEGCDMVEKDNMFDRDSIWRYTS